MQELKCRWPGVKQLLDLEAVAPVFEGQGAAETRVAYAAPRCS